MECWVLSDGAAGNVRQAEALAQALGLRSERITLAARLPWRLLAPRRWPGSERAFGPAFAARLAAPPALAIGCGRQAALATRLLRSRGARVVQVLDPRISPACFDAVVAPAHDGLAGPNVVTCLGALHPVDASWLTSARLRFAALSALPRPLTLLALGGPTARLRMTPRWFAGLADTLERWLARDGGGLLVTSSRRTPEWLRRAVRHRFDGVPGQQWHGGSDADNPYAGFLAHADRIVVTADSTNLISEAAGTGVPVLVYAPAPLRGKPARLYAALRERGNVQPLRPDYAPWQPAPLRELPRVASEVAALLGLPPPGDR